MFARIVVEVQNLKTSLIDKQLGFSEQTNDLRNFQFSKFCNLISLIRRSLTEKSLTKFYQKKFHNRLCLKFYCFLTTPLVVALGTICKWEIFLRMDESIKGLFLISHISMEL